MGTTFGMATPKAPTKIASPKTPISIAPTSPAEPAPAKMAEDTPVPMDPPISPTEPFFQPATQTEDPLLKPPAASCTGPPEDDKLADSQVQKEVRKIDEACAGGEIRSPRRKEAKAAGQHSVAETRKGAAGSGGA